MTTSVATAKPRLRHRTIVLPGNRGQHISVAAGYLGISGEQFISDAVVEHLRRTYAEMTEDLSQ
jgi:hypothetical protein